MSTHDLNISDTPSHSPPPSGGPLATSGAGLGPLLDYVLALADHEARYAAAVHGWRIGPSADDDEAQPDFARFGLTAERAAEIRGRVLALEGEVRP